MRDGLNRRGFLGALGALTALIVATPLAARTVRRPPAALTEKAPPITGTGMAVDMATVAFIYKKLYAQPALLPRPFASSWVELRRG